MFHTFFSVSIVDHEQLNVSWVSFTSGNEKVKIFFKEKNAKKWRRKNYGLGDQRGKALSNNQKMYAMI